MRVTLYAAEPPEVAAALQGLQRAPIGAKTAQFAVGSAAHARRRDRTDVT